MSNLLEKYNASFEKDARKFFKEERNETLKSLNKYNERLAQGKENMTIAFDLADEEGNLIYTDEDGVRFVMTDEGFDRPQYNNQSIKKDRLTGIAMQVVIDHVDEENNTVYVRNAQTRKDIKGAVMKELFKELDSGNRPRLWGDIVTVNSGMATVNILHKNVLGLLKAGDYRSQYTSDLTRYLKPGQPIEFEVIRPAQKIPGKDQAFVLSRKNITRDTWQTMPEHKVGEVIVVRCVDKPKGRTYFWGQYNGAKEIDIMCDYPNKSATLINALYRAKIVEFDRENHKFKVSPFEMISSPIGVESN